MFISKNFKFSLGRFAKAIPLSVVILTQLSSFINKANAQTTTTIESGVNRGNILVNTNRVILNNGSIVRGSLVITDSSPASTHLFVTGESYVDGYIGQGSDVAANRRAFSQADILNNANITFDSDRDYVFLNFSVNRAILNEDGSFSNIGVNDFNPNSQAVVNINNANFQARFTRFYNNSTLNLLNNNGETLTTSLSLNNGARLNLGLGDHNLQAYNLNGYSDPNSVAGNFDVGRFTSDGGVISVNLASSNVDSNLVNSGSLTASGYVTVDSASKVQLNLADNHAAFREARSGVVTDIVSTEVNDSRNSIVADLDSSNILIQDDNGNVTSGGRIGLVQYQIGASADGKSLQRSAFIDQSQLGDIANNPIIDAIDSSNPGPNSETAQLQEYLYATNGVTNDQRNVVLNSLNPNNVGLNRATFEAIQNNIKVIESRLFAARQEDSLNFFARERDEKNKAIRTVDKDGNEVEPFGFDGGSAYAQGASSAIDLLYANEKLKNSLWVQTIYSSAKQDDTSKFIGYRSNQTALTIGFDRKVEKNLRAGIALTLGNGTIENLSNTKETDFDSYRISLYGEKLIRTSNPNLDYFVDAYVSASMNRFDSTRIATTGLGSVNAYSDFDGQTYSAKAKTGLVKRFSDSNFIVTPEVSALYSYNRIEDHVESGAGSLNLHNASADAEMLEGEVAIALGYENLEFESIANKLGLDQFIVHPQIKVGYAYDFIGNQQSTDSNFVGSEVVFNTVSARRNRRALRYDASVDIYTKDSLSFTASFIHEEREDYRSDAGLFRVRWEF